VLAALLVLLAMLDIYLSRHARKKERAEHKEMVKAIERFIIYHDKIRDIQRLPGNCNCGKPIEPDIKRIPESDFRG
jgi:hypothetical protein